MTLSSDPEIPHPSPQASPSRRVPRVLIVDDEADLRELLELTLIGMGFDVDCAADVKTALGLIEANTYSLCLTDMRLPDGDGLQLVAAISNREPHFPVAVITAYGSAENAVAALKAGAFDYLAKPVALDALRALVRSAIADGQSADGGSAPDGVARGDGRRLIGSSPAMAEVRSQILRLARSMAPVAITGESGTGKELAARMIHASGPRAAGPFIAVNCGAIPETLMEAEFFGHRKGAFTGADHERDGFFQAARAGTLFLDEVADLPFAMQVKLLRAIQEKRVRKVGGTVEEPVDVRIVSATHQDLAQCVEAGRFRSDLYYRLNVIGLRLPPLRERTEDIPELAAAILDGLARRAGMLPVPRLSPAATRYLSGYAFPGNVRELENLLERALAFSNGESVGIEDLGLQPSLSMLAESERAGDPAPAGSVAGEGRGGAAGAAPEAAPERRPVRISEEGIPDSLPDYLDQIEREAILRALEKTRHNRTAAARLLGITFRALRYRMQRLGLN
ncbi:MAG: sigma-54 dependent transcriptional regulator [Burkholderiaceae bacterium]